MGNGTKVSQKNRIQNNMLKIYQIFHINLMYSSIANEDQLKVILLRNLMKPSNRIHLNTQ